jgi:phosphatidylglycerophosphatase A
MNTTPEPKQPKPLLALAIATGLGLGYLPKAPGTWGSLLGVLLAWGVLSFSAVRPIAGFLIGGGLAIVVSLLGLWAADRAAAYLQKKDPQIVVVDEIAGQLVAYAALGINPALALNWKYLLAGFILFRVFDIWKPFPGRLAESFPGGAGIIADDWVAGVYAALALGLARQLGF